MLNPGLPGFFLIILNFSIMQDFYYLGKVTKLFGLKGELNFFLDVDDVDEYNDLKSVFIELNDDKVPFKIDRFTIKNRNTAIAKLAVIKNLEDAQKYINKKLFLPIDTLPKLKGKSFYFHEVIGFAAFGLREGEIGKIVDINNQTMQSLLVIENNGKEILFPVSDELIDKIDRKQKRIYLDIPEGLLEIYL